MSVTLVACVSRKRPESCAACDLYDSLWFRKARALAEARGGPWFILSALHGLVGPGVILSPYDVTLGRHDTIWAGNVVDGLRSVVDPCPVLLLAGRRYADPLVPLLEEHGFAVELPLRGMGIGQQVAWLGKQVEESRRS